MLPQVRIEPGPLINLWFQVQHSPFWANWELAFKNEIPGLLIPTKSSKSQNQVWRSPKKHILGKLRKASVRLGIRG